MLPHKAEFKLTMAPDTRSVLLEILVNGVVKGWGNIDDASQLDTFIQALASARIGMSEPVPTALEPNPRLSTTEHPNFWVFDPDSSGQMLALRHPGFGWLGFLLAPDRADEIAGFLAKRSKPKPNRATRRHAR